jgi:hypothetical protein
MSLWKSHPKIINQQFNLCHNNVELLKNATWCGLIYFADDKTMWHGQKTHKKYSSEKKKNNKRDTL